MVEGITIQASPAACPRPCPGLSGGQDQSTLGLGARASRPLWSGHLAHAGPATRDLGPAPRDWGKGLALPLGFVHFALTAKYQLTTALARLRERGDREAVGEGFADLPRSKQALTPGFAVPSPLGEGRYQLRPRCESKCRNSRVPQRGTTLSRGERGWG